MVPTKLTYDQIDRLRADLQMGRYSFRKLAEIYNVHEKTISRYNDKFGMKRPKPNRELIIYDLNNTTLTQTAIAEKYGICDRTVRNIKKENKNGTFKTRIHR